MHDSLHKYVEAKVLQRQLQDKNVLEVGSLNVNGSIRQLFTGNYLGVDMREGGLLSCPVIIPINHQTPNLIG